jgi:hypothetical protein
VLKDKDLEFANSIRPVIAPLYPHHKIEGIRHRVRA